MLSGCVECRAFGAGVDVTDTGVHVDSIRRRSMRRATSTASGSDRFAVATSALKRPRALARDRVRDASRSESALVAPQEPGQLFQVDAMNQRIRVSMHELPLRLS
jgi:predicted KAP-like P-loop ATPase